MFNVGFTEVLVIALVSIVVIDKQKLPVFIDFVKSAYSLIVRIRIKAQKLLRETGIESLYQQNKTEKVNYIVGEDSKLYPAYNINDTFEDNDSKDPNSR